MEKRRTDQVLVNKNFLLVLFALVIVLVIVSAVLLGVVVSDRKDDPQQAENQIPIENEQTPPEEVSTEPPTAPSGVGSYRVNTSADALNMRAQPLADAEIVTTIPKGTIISVTAVNGEWGYVTYQDASGWVNMQYLAVATTAAGAASATGSAG